MEELSKLHRDVPYGWALVAAALWRAAVDRRRKAAEPGGREGMAGDRSPLSHPRKARPGVSACADAMGS